MFLAFIDSMKTGVPFAYLPDGINVLDEIGGEAVKAYCHMISQKDKAIQSVDIDMFIEEFAECIDPMGSFSFDLLIDGNGHNLNRYDRTIWGCRQATSPAVLLRAFQGKIQFRPLHRALQRLERTSFSPLSPLPSAQALRPAFRILFGAS